MHEKRHWYDWMFGLSLYLVVMGVVLIVVSLATQRSDALVTSIVMTSLGVVGTLVGFVGTLIRGPVDDDDTTTNAR